MSKKNDKKAEKTEKKARKQRAKMRSRKDSVAGHFADRLAANEKQRQDIFRAIKDFPGVNPTVSSVHDVAEALESLAADGFRPERKKGGNRGPVFTPGQKVTLATEAIELLKPQMPDIDTRDLFVSVSYVPGTKGAIPVRANGAQLSDQWVGYVAKKSVSAAA